MKTLMLSAVLAIQVFGADTNSITTREGTTYTNAVIQRADPNGIVIEYAIRPGALGLAKLKFANLPETLQRRYNYNTTNAQIFEQNQLSGSLRTLTAEERARKDAEAWAAYWASVRRSEEIAANVQATEEAAQKKRDDEERKKQEEKDRKEQLQREAVYQQLQWMNDSLYQIQQQGVRR
jgi:hypothetical protein